MVFRRLLALLASSPALAGGCTPRSNSSQTAGPSQCRRSALPRDSSTTVGPAYPDAAAAGLVDRVGQRLVSQAGVPAAIRFFVLDQPVANAHALPSGYVFVTRGLLALIDDEAELAAAMGHELGHVIERHAAQRERQRQGVMDAAVEAAM